MATSASTFEERIARAKEAARLASLAAAARGAQQPLQMPPPLTSSFPAFPPRGLVPTARPGSGIAMPFHASVPPPYPTAAAFTTAAAPAPPASAIPDDVRHCIDRLAEFIQRNGPAFEETVRQRERENPNFAFLHPASPFHDYFVWKKRELCGGGGGAVTATIPAVAPAVAVAPPTPDALLSAMSVGAMASVCKLARKNGLAAYAPLPPELLWPPAALPSVEPARLEVRLAEFYRELPALP